LILFQVRFVKQIGGSTLSDCVKRAWESVLTLEVRAFVNWNGKLRTGQPQKYGLKKTKVTEAVFSRLFYITIYLLLSHVLITYIHFHRGNCVQKCVPGRDGVRD